ncbi:MAG: amino acid permease [Gemmatimonadales bacterium]|nr:amino acid permease [Gemmatimonadales bacterium]
MTTTERLPRTIGLFSAVAVIVGTTIGSGIFRVPAAVATKLGEPGPILLAWVLGGMLALFGALTLAEMAAMYPRSGGVFAYIEEAFGPFPAFLFGWSQLAVIRASALGGIATVFAEYLAYFTHFTPFQVRVAAAVTILIVAAINYLGVRNASRVVNVAMVAKYLGMVGLVVLAFAFGSGDWGNFTASGSATPTAFSLSMVGAALVSIMWAYDGWADLSYIGGEIKDPGRNFPLALIVGTILIIAIYLALNAAYIYLVPVAEQGQQSSSIIASRAAERIPLLGSAGGGIVAAIVMISCFGTLNGSMLTNPRIFFAMADRGLFFKGVARVSPRFQTPSVAIWLAAILGCAYVLFNDFQQLADRFVLGIWPFYILAILAVFVMRKRAPDAERPYRTVGYPIVPIVFLLAAVGMVVNAFVTDPFNTGVTFAIIGVGVPVYYATIRRKQPGT